MYRLVCQAVGDCCLWMSYQFNKSTNNKPNFDHMYHIGCCIAASLPYAPSWHVHFLSWNLHPYHFGMCLGINGPF